MFMDEITTYRQVELRGENVRNHAPFSLGAHEMVIIIKH